MKRRRERNFCQRPGQRSMQADLDIWDELSGYLAEEDNNMSKFTREFHYEQTMIRRRARAKLEKESNNG